MENVVVFLITIWIIIILFSARCVCIIALVAEKYYFSKSSLLEKAFDQYFIWGQFVSFKAFLDHEQRLSSGNNILKVVSYLMWEYILILSQY